MKMNIFTRTTIVIKIMVFSFALPCAATTIRASAITSLPLPDIQLSAKGAYSENDKKIGYTKLMLMPNKSNPGVAGYGNVVVSTSKGSFSVKLPLCQDKDQWVCWNNPAYWVSVPPFDGQSVTGGTNPVITGLSVSGILQNLTEERVSVMLKIQSTDDNYWGGSSNGFSTIAKVTLPASTVCSMDVNTLPDFGKITPGKASTPIQITSNASGNGRVTFKPADYDGNRGLIKNREGEALRYYVEGLTSTATDFWQGNLTRDYYLKLDTVPATAKPGEYTGTINTTLSCE